MPFCGSRGGVTFALTPYELVSPYIRQRGDELHLTDPQRWVRAAVLAGVVAAAVLVALYAEGLWHVDEALDYRYRRHIIAGLIADAWKKRPWPTVTIRSYRCVMELAKHGQVFFRTNSDRRNVEEIAELVRRYREQVVGTLPVKYPVYRVERPMVWMLLAGCFALLAIAVLLASV